MKKIFTICLLAVTLLAGGIKAEVKTTKNSKSINGRTSKRSSGSYSVSGFIQITRTGYALKSLKEVKSILTSNGFKYHGSKYTQVYGLDADRHIFIDSKGNEVLVIAITGGEAIDDVNEITFNFINSAERDKFTNGKKSELYGAFDQVELKVNGNTVKLTDDCYYC